MVNPFSFGIKLFILKVINECFLVLTIENQFIMPSGTTSFAFIVYPFVCLKCFLRPQFFYLNKDIAIFDSYNITHIVLSKQINKGAKGARWV